MFPCILEMMRKVLPGWEGMIFLKDLHSHYSFFLFMAGRQETEKGLCGSVCILFLSFTGDIRVCRAHSGNFCYFFKILNHRCQKNTLKGNPLTLSLCHLFRGLQFSEERLFSTFPVHMVTEPVRKG